MNRIFFLLLVTLCSIRTKAGTKDSLLIRHYIDEAYRYGIYHPQYQQYFDSLVLRFPDRAYFWQQKGMPLFKAGIPERGMPCLDKAVALDSSWIDYRAYMKCIFARDYAGCITDFKHAMRIKGQSYIMDHSYAFYMALAYIQLGQRRQADSLLTISIGYYSSRKVPPHYLELFYKGILQLHDQNFTMALHTMDEVLSLYSGFPEAHYYKAYILEILGMADGAPDRSSEILALYRRGKENLLKGYSLNEDNAIYIDYPFQVRAALFDRTIHRLEEATKTNSK